MTVSITIDGRQLCVEEGMDVLEAALQNGIYIPHLCHHPDLPELGSCRLCIVEVEGQDGVQPSCKLHAADGMVIRTKSERITKLRNLSMELLLAAHPEDCSTCPKYGKCELQTLIQYMGVSATRMTVRVKGLKLDERNPLLVHDMNRCVLCGRCVRACKDLRQVGVLQYNKKNLETYVGTLHDKLLKDADCRFCGACAEVCPTGTIRDALNWNPTEKRDTLIPCTAECPAHADVPRYVRLVKEGRYDEATAVIHERIPFPECLGRVCAHTCEGRCRRGEVNEPVSIRNIKRYAAEHTNNELWKKNQKRLPATGKKVCVVGGGPAGMTAAFYLAKQGHAVTLKEAYPTLGGQMAYGIPSYRLPREVIAKEAAYLDEVGVQVECNCRVAKPAELLNDFDAVLVSGLSREALEEKLGARENVKGFVTAALRNTDTERRKEALLEKNPAGLVAGLKALTVLTGAQGAVLVTPAEGVEDALLQAANEAELTLCIEKKSDLVKFDHRDDLLVALDEAAGIAAVLVGEEVGVLGAVDDGELMEMPADTKLTALLPDTCKAVLTDHRFRAPTELEGLTLAQLGSKSGVLRVLNDRDCLVDRAKKELLTLREKSCGRCTFCREGLFQLGAIVGDLSTGRLRPQALELAKELTEAMRVSTSCSLGEDAGSPMASLLAAFPQKVEAHARRKECPAGVCAAFTTFYIDPNKCVGSRDCVKVCPAHAIEAKPGYTAMIESFDCTKCGACLTVCAQGAIVRVSGKARVPDKPARLKGVAVEAAPAEEAPAKREGAGKRKRSFARPAGSAAPAVPAVPTAEEKPAPAPAPVPAPTVAPAPAPVPEAVPAPKQASEPVIRREGSGGKRKRVFAKPIKPE